ncbi:MAG TPA: Mur ligase family protein [Candidatus Paceibacterota bacterium]|jgi:UDP-N-acetylmuramate: L-alanyl-gamma-D-glutamyl-meso-diaminopimelate ligase|nr:Mur ligase family protein [Candidatus Paceibacterota bacterium]
MNLPKHVHVIGICGVATSALAIAFHKAGVKVTGSDKGFFPPVSTELEKQGITFYAGWHPEKMVADGIPDLVVITTASGTQNPETIYARENNIPSLGYTEVFGKYFIKEKSIVCTGTWGKTSSSALLSHILEQAHLDPSYMFGGVSLSHESSAKITDSEWSVFEGDEYKSSPTDPTAKFFYYKPTHLLLSAISWDHADLYPTEESYFDAFKKLTSNIPETGLIVANMQHTGVEKTLRGSTKKIVSYGLIGSDYSYSDISQTKDGLSFVITHAEKTYKITSPMLGSFQAENITGCFAMAHNIGITPEKIISSIATFAGLKRRLEKRVSGDITVFDDIAHSPEKASSVLKNLREIYTGKIIAIFEPNIGGRERESAYKYDNAFKDADTVVIPRLTKLKVAENAVEVPMDGKELSETIQKTHKNINYMEDDSALVDFLVATAKKDDCIVFLGSHGFRGMIEETVKKLS